MKTQLQKLLILLKSYYSKTSILLQNYLKSVFSHVNTHKKWYQRGVIIVSIICVLALTSFFLGNQIQFFVANELITKHEVSNPIHYITNGENATVDFLLSLSAHSFCQTQCDITVRDLSSKNDLFSIYRQTSSSYTESFSFSIPISKKGLSYIPIQIQTQCVNTQSFLCPSSQKVVPETSLIHIFTEFNTTENEFVLDEESREVKLEVISQTIRDLQTIITFYEQEEMRNSFENQIILNSYKEKQQYFYELLEVLFSKWNSHQILQTQEVLELVYQQSLMQKVESTRTIEHMVKRKEFFLDSAQLFLELEELQSVVFTRPVMNSTYLQDKKDTLMSKLQEFERLLYSSFFIPESDLDSFFDQILIVYDSMRVIFLEIQSAQERVVGQKNFLQQQLQIYEAIPHTFRENETIDSELVCSQLSQLLLAVETIDSETIIEQMSQENPYSEDLSFVFIQNTTSISSQSYTKVCDADEQLTSLLDVIHIPQLSLQQEELNITLSQINRKCFFSNESIPCNTLKPQTPIIFIHGHAFLEQSSVEESLQAFSQIQFELQQDGFVSARTFDIGTYAIDEKPYTYIPRPVTFRSSFYTINSFSVGSYGVSIRKTERIENYALRLREIIDDVRRVTKSQNVSIVAHSMGGLVLREYLQLFGDSAIEKSITINTPHQGIVGRVASLCRTAGSNKECEDMTKGSIFLQRLSQQQLPDSFYSIQAVGCQMGDTTGDGIVQVEQSIIDANMILVNGTCTDLAQTNLHTDILRVDKYPQLVDILRDILMDD